MGTEGSGASEDGEWNGSEAERERRRLAACLLPVGNEREKLVIMLGKNREINQSTAPAVLIIGSGQASKAAVKKRTGVVTGQR
jgi:DNA-directed RNA polymerase specialized sigma subunit